MENNKIPTAEEFIEKNIPSTCIVLPEWLIEFAKLHVEAALKEASKKIYFRDSDGFILNTSEESKNIILNSYPLENIK
jgi:hypothetical protein